MFQVEQVTLPTVGDEIAGISVIAHPVVTLYVPGSLQSCAAFGAGWRLGVAQAVYVVLVHAKVVSDLVDEGGPDFLNQLLLIGAGQLNGPLEEGDLVRQRGRGALPVDEGHPLVEAEEVMAVRYLGCPHLVWRGPVLDYYGHVLQEAQGFLGQSIEGTANQPVELPFQEMHCGAPTSRLKSGQAGADSLQAVQVGLVGAAAVDAGDLQKERHVPEGGMGHDHLEARFTNVALAYVLVPVDP